MAKCPNNDCTNWMPGTAWVFSPARRRFGLKLGFLLTKCRKTEQYGSKSTTPAASGPQTCGLPPPSKLMPHEHTTTPSHPALPRGHTSSVTKSSVYTQHGSWIKHSSTLHVIRSRSLEQEPALDHLLRSRFQERIRTPTQELSMICIRLLLIPFLDRRFSLASWSRKGREGRCLWCWRAMTGT